VYVEVVKEVVKEVDVVKLVENTHKVKAQVALANVAGMSVFVGLFCLSVSVCVCLFCPSLSVFVGLFYLSFV
jgi:hypothetical protein